MSASLQQRPRRVAAWRIRRSAQGAVLHATGTSAPVALNRTALALWELCDGVTTVQEMVQAVCELFDIDGVRARRDVSSALAEMRRAGVVE